MNHERKGLITPSGFADMMKNDRAGKDLGDPAKNYAMEVALERIGVEPEELNTPAIRHGNDWEPYAIEEFEKKKGLLVLPLTGFVQHPTINYMGGTPDGLIGDDAIIEVKCPFNSENHLINLVYNNQQFTKDYFYQVQGYLEITQRKKCYCVSFDPRFPQHLRLKITEIERDETTINAILERESIINEMVKKICAPLLT